VANAQPAGKAQRKQPETQTKVEVPAAPEAADAGVLAEAKKAPKRVPPGRLRLVFAGELVLVKNPDRDLAGLFRRYEALFEAFANMEKPERILNYKLLSALMLTSHAKKAAAQDEKKRLFDMKNRIYLHLANDRDARRKLAFMYLASKNFRVTDFCADCIAKNTEAALKRHNWKFCKSCKIDRNFYNVLSMHHKFKDGSATIFLSNDLVAEVKGLQVKKKGKLEDITEEALFQRYHYNVRNLDAFELKSVEDWVKRLMPGIQTPPGAVTTPASPAKP